MITGPQPAVPDERLADRTVSTASFLSGAEASLPATASTVVIGAGLVGASTAAHLAELGQTDVLLLERHSVASGSSWHAAGLLARMRGSHQLTELASYGVEVYRDLERRTGMPVAFNQNGSITLARQAGRVDELAVMASMARHHGIEAHLLSPAEVTALHPLVCADGVLAALHQPGDAMVNPGWSAAALARWAHDAGATIREGVRVTGIELTGPDGARRVAGVLTDAGRVATERLVVCAGAWTRELVASAGVAVPLYAAEHVHVTSGPVEGAVPSLPLLRDLDAYLYIRHHRGCLVVGAFEPNGRPRAMSTIGEDFAFGELEPDWEHFAPIRANAERVVPALRAATYERFLCAPESFTPDVNFCLGPTPEVTGLFVGAGFNSQGVIYAPGAGRELARWVVDGAPGFDSAAVDVARFDPAQANRRYLHERTRESLGRLYAMHWPHQQAQAARGVRRTPLTERLADAGACLGEANGWERPLWFARPGEQPQIEYSYRRQNWFEASAAEHGAARDAVAFFDLSSFGKLEVCGPDALAVLQRLFTADLDLPVGRVVYTLALHPTGGIHLDGTVLRLGVDRFAVVVPTLAHRTAAWALRRAVAGTACRLTDRSSATAVLHLAGPSAAELLARITPFDDIARTLPRFSVRRAEIADAVGWVARVSFTGERGYELYVPADYAVGVFDAIVAEGADLGLRLAGLNALDSLRAEVGYRHLGHDIGPTDDPVSAGLARFVALDKPGGFVGRDAVAVQAARARDGAAVRRQGFVRLEDPAPVLVHGESVLVDGTVAGHVTSGAYGHSIGSACGLVTMEPGVLARLTGGEPLPVAVDVLGTEAPAVISLQPFRTAVG